MLREGRTCHPSCPIKKSFLFLKLRYTPCLPTKGPWGNEHKAQTAEEGRHREHFKYQSLLLSTHLSLHLPPPPQLLLTPQTGALCGADMQAGKGTQLLQSHVRNTRVQSRVSPHFCDQSIIATTTHRSLDTWGRGPWEKRWGPGTSAHRAQGASRLLPTSRSSHHKPRTVSSLGNKPVHTLLSIQCAKQCSFTFHSHNMALWTAGKNNHDQLVSQLC